ncbi:MAG: 1-aminocyclopropane-1-carboxylate deaminase/D-cysteine desulfhydrase [Candidatus Bipolaricaulaceae bacterium]
MQLGKVPRLRLGEYPTPLSELARLSAHLGGPRIFVKREDLVGIALGGNKVRKLEYALAEAKELGATAIVTSGAVQSNHVRLTIACANRLGLRTFVVLRGEKPATPTGNLLLDHLLGAAEIHWVDPKGYASREELVRATEARAEELAEELRRRGEVPYVIPNGCKPLHSALAYAGCVLEVLEQMRAMNLAPDAIVTACGTAGTQTGLVLGSLLFAQGQIRVVGVSVSGRAESLKERIWKNLEEALRFLELDLKIPGGLIEVYDEYVGPGYALPTPGMKEAVELLARMEGILLDPVYTGKAMAGLLDLVRRRTFGKGETVVFLHTGGVPALFADTQAPTFFPAP